MEQKEIKDWITLMPIGRQQDFEEVELPLDLGNSIKVIKTPDWIKGEEIRKNFSPHHNSFIEGSGMSFAIEYKAGEYGDPDPEWKGKKPRGLQDKAHELIIFTNLALWLAKPTAFNCRVVIHASKLEGEWSWRNTGAVEPIRVLNRDSHEKIESKSLDLARKLNNDIKKLNRSGVAWIALNTLHKALMEGDWSIRYMMLWIVLESMFGPDDSRELSFRLNQRISLFVSNTKKEAMTNFQKIKGYYRLRSKVVHGMKIENLAEEESQEAIGNSEDLIRKALIKIFNDEKLKEKFNDKDQREKYLDELVFFA